MREKVVLTYPEREFCDCGTITEKAYPQTVIPLETEMALEIPSDD